MVRMIKKGYARSYVVALLTALVLQVPFAILVFIPRSGLGPGPGVLFFVPSIALIQLFSTNGISSAISIASCQTLLTAIPIFWLITWRQRPAWATMIRLACFIGLLIVASTVLIRFERRRGEWHSAVQGSTHSAVLGSIERLNNSLAFYQRKYGQYPEKLEQLDFPRDGADINSTRSALVEFPLPMQEFFGFTYSARRSDNGQYSGYELHVDAKPGSWSALHHYCSDETGSIRFSTSYNTCMSGLIIKAQGK